MKAVAHGGSGDMGTQRGADRQLAVLVYHDVEAADEILGVVEVEGPPKSSLMVEELEFIFPALDKTGRQRAPVFTDLQDRQRRGPPVRQVAPERERQCPAWRLVEDERSRWFEVQHGAVSLEELRDACQIAFQIRDRQLHPPSGAL